MVQNVCPVGVNVDLLLHVSSGKTTGIPIHVFGTETHMTAIVGMALGHRPIPKEPPVAAHTANFLLSSGSASVGHRVHVVRPEKGNVLLCTRWRPEFRHFDVSVQE